MFDVVNPVPKYGLQQIQKLLKGPREDMPGDDFDEISKVIPTVECDISDTVVAQKARWHQELSKTSGRDAVLASRIEVHSLVAEEVNWVRGVIITRDVKILEIELPDETATGETEVGEIPKLVGERDPHLNELERVYVRFERLVPVDGVSVGRMVTNNDAGELRIHWNKGVAVD